MAHEAQRDILKMLSDNVITVEEAERLLRALQDGEKKEKHAEPRSGKHSHRRPSHGVGSIFDSIGDTLAEIGPMVKNTVEDVIAGVVGEDLGDLEEDDLEPVEPIDGTYHIPTGTQVIIMNAAHITDCGGDVRLRGVEGEQCRIEGASANRLNVRQNAGQFVIRWGGGPLTVDVPESAAAVKVRTKGGDLRVRNIACDLNLKTFGGNLKAEDIQNNFKARTMGGDVRLKLADSWNGTGRVRTAGGNVKLMMPDAVSAYVDATTVGGKITVDDSWQTVENTQQFPGKCQVKLQLGDTDADASITIKTMGGDIKLGTVRDEE